MFASWSSSPEAFLPAFAGRTRTGCSLSNSISLSLRDHVRMLIGVFQQQQRRAAPRASCSPAFERTAARSEEPTACLIRRRAWAAFLDLALECIAGDQRILQLVFQRLNLTASRLPTRARQDCYRPAGSRCSGHGSRPAASQPRGAAVRRTGSGVQGSAARSPYRSAIRRWHSR